MGQKYAHYDLATGRILGFYEDGQHAAIPEPKLALTDETHAQIAPDHRAWRVEAGGLVAAGTAGPGIEEVRAAALEDAVRLAVDMAAPFVAGIPAAERDGWAVKEAAAVRVLAATSTPEDEQLLDIEAAETGETRTGLAQTILEQAAIYRMVVGRISGVRRRARTAILTAETEAQIDAALAQARASRDQLLAEQEA